MRNSSICRNALLGVVLFVFPAWTLDSRRPLTEFHHDKWGIEQGFTFGAVYAIAQTSDGYLWVGTDQGLVRFDGKSFHLLVNREGALPSGRVLGLIADNENNLWIRLATEGLFRYRNGAINDMLAGRPDRQIAMMYRRADGTPIFQSVRSETLVYEHGMVKPVPMPARIGATVAAIAESADRTLWFGTREDGLFYLRRPQQGILPTSLRSAKIKCLTPAGDGDLWIGLDSGISRWNGSNVSKEGVPLAIRDVQAASMIRDSEGNIWIGAPTGLLRVASGVVATLDDHQSRPQSVTVLFEDREGNIWFGGAQGLERLREDPFATYSRIPASENTPEDNGPLWADPAGRLWFAPSTGGLSWRLGYTVQHIANQSLDKDVIYSIAGDQDEIWLGRQEGGLTRVRLADARIAQTYTKVDGLAAGSVFCVYRSRDGAVWAGTIGGGVSRFKDGAFQTFTSAQGLASNSVTAIEEGSDGTMWFATTGGLSSFSNRQWRSYRRADGLPPHEITCLAADGGILWIGTSQGLAFLRDRHITAVDQVPSALYESIVGIAVAPEQAEYPATLWIATDQSVLRVNCERLLSGKVDGGDLRIFDAQDGLRGTGNLKRSRSVITDPTGRIWFSTNRGVAVVDPSALAKRSSPVITHIQAAMADESTLGAADELEGGGLLRVPASPHRVVFNYVGLCLADPARVLFRYRLDGYDTAWSNPTPSREAAYTNLGPGPYRFRVMARNMDGVWNSAEAATDISIAPRFWQTWWFLGLDLCVVGAVAIGLVRLRTHRLTTELNVRFEERLRERTRIAQELHDTLLQGFLGACMKLEVALDRVPESSPARSALDGALSVMRRVIGRRAQRRPRIAASRERVRIPGR